MSNIALLTAAERETLTLLADHGLNISRVSEASFYSRKAIYDRIRNIKEKTGIDPQDFWGLHRLLTLMEEEKEANGHQ